MTEYEQVLTLLYFMHDEMPAVALGGLIFSGQLAHGVVSRRAANAGVSLDAVPIDHQDNSAGIFHAGEKLDAVGAGVVRLGEKLAKSFDVLVAFLRLDMLYNYFLDHWFFPSVIPRLM